MSSSCEKTDNKVYVDEEVVTKKYLSKLTLEQIASLNNINQFLYVNDANKKVYLKNARPDDNKGLIFSNSDFVFIPDFKTKSYWNQIETEYNNIKIINKKSDVAYHSLFREHDFNAIKEHGGYNAGWFYYLGNLININKDYYRIDDPYFLDFQTIIFRLVYDLWNNYGLVKTQNIRNNKNKTILLNNIFRNEYIDANAWLSDESEIFRKTFINFLIIYLNKFNLHIKLIDIDWKNSEILKNKDGAYNFISFSINKIELFNGSLLANELFKNKKFYINNFRNYATNLKFGVGSQGLKEIEPLFNNHVQNPLLEFKSLAYLDIKDNINFFIKGYDSVDYWNSRGLVYLINKFNQKMLNLSVPDIYKNKEKEYRIEKATFTDYFNTSQLIRLHINVVDINNHIKKYVLLSSNFDDHGHYLKGLALKNLAIEKLTGADYYAFRDKKDYLPSGIALDDFVDMDQTKPFGSLVLRAINKIYSKWENRNETDINALDINNEALLTMTAYLNNYLLAYALETEQNKINSGIKKIELTKIENQGNGEAILTFGFYKFINDADVEFSTDNEQPFYEMKIKLFGFKGYQGDKQNQFELVKKGVK
ncbi:MAG3240 family lipoprotein [Metamycoplasma neophronis]|uniref:Lipoprotein n=1 Tax=Metamycoplasma neophronis TaxID=872983 RepID=A0ABY2Z047_9BACT|nr:hypothetical protein [Metamycoplasma neophronis]TPR54114.1 hypothetical protein FJR74_01590 [Metamycoplasma neophronis]